MLFTNTVVLVHPKFMTLHAARLQNNITKNLFTLLTLMAAAAHTYDIRRREEKAFF